MCRRLQRRRLDSAGVRVRVRIRVHDFGYQYRSLAASAPTY